MSIIFKNMSQVTFKNRIIFLFLFSSLIPFIFLGLISFYTINSILSNKVEHTLQSKLEQDLSNLENILNNVNHVSQQLAFGVGTNKLIEEMNNAHEPFERIQLVNEIKDELNVISFSNPNIGLMLYYYPETSSYKFENFGIRGEFRPEQLPIMEKYSDITYFGPHKSYSSSINQYVFSTLRKVNILDQDVYLYIETGRSALENLFAPLNRKNDSRRLLILDNNGSVAFSENQQAFAEGSLFPSNHSTTKSGTYGAYFWNKATSNQGWSIVSFIPVNELNAERNQWFLQIIMFFFVFLIVAVLFAWLLLKMVYIPLNKFNNEISSLIKTNAEHTALTKIPEFDYLLYQFRSMKRKIWNLYEEIEHKEKKRADLEVEKLLYQINPHFLMNTLDTVHWLAVFSGQEKINKLVLSLNKLLSYNLGKMGEATMIRKEVESLNDYVQLQQIRYDFQFNVNIEVDDNTLNMPIPRFILQPLVENALYHGVSDAGYIYVEIKLRGDQELEITVQDNGAGMRKEEINRLLLEDESNSKKVGMGIGVKYVKRILEANYGDQAKLEIKSELGKGTIVSLRIPVG